MRRLLMVLLSLVLIAGAGCAKKEAGPKDRVLARINGYELTVDDFNNETRLTISNKYLAGDARKDKEVLLDEIIAKKLILQEAQKENFDKDKAFMKEIERYWEQALIKLMVRKKMGDLAGQITVDAREVKDEYDRMPKDAGLGARPFDEVSSEIRDYIYRKKMDALFNGWLEKIKKQSDIRIYKENL